MPKQPYFEATERRAPQLQEFDEVIFQLQNRDLTEQDRQNLQLKYYELELAISLQHGDGLTLVYPED